MKCSFLILTAIFSATSAFATDHYVNYHSRVAMNTSAIGNHNGKGYQEGATIVAGAWSPGWFLPQGSRFCIVENRWSLVGGKPYHKFHFYEVPQANLINNKTDVFLYGTLSHTWQAAYFSGIGLSYLGSAYLPRNASSIGGNGMFSKIVKTLKPKDNVRYKFCEYNDVFDDEGSFTLMPDGFAIPMYPDGTAIPM